MNDGFTNIVLITENYILKASKFSDPNRIEHPMNRAINPQLVASMESAILLNEVNIFKTLPTMWQSRARMMVKGCK